MGNVAAGWPCLGNSVPKRICDGCWEYYRGYKRTKHPQERHSAHAVICEHFGEDQMWKDGQGDVW